MENRINLCNIPIDAFLTVGPFLERSLIQRNINGAGYR